MIRISFIIPCYNVEKHLQETIDSIINNTKDNIEIILVNDGSADNTINIINSNKRKYPDIIKIVDQHNMGLSMARNKGLSVATGEYVSFIDAEDSIKEGLYEKIIDKINEYDYDIIVFDEDRVFKDHHEYVDSGVNEDCHSKEDIKKIMYKIYPAACNKIYKKSIIEKIPFKRGIWYEDVEFIYRLLPELNSIGVIKGYYYNYIQMDNSITYTYNSKLYDLIDNLNGLIKYYKDNNYFEEYHQELEYAYIRYSFATFVKRLAKMKNKKEFNKGVKEVIENVKNNFPNYKKNKYLIGKKGQYLKHFNKTIANIIYILEKDKKN